MPCNNWDVKQESKFEYQFLPIYLEFEENYHRHVIFASYFKMFSKINWKFIIGIWVGDAAQGQY